MRSFVLGSLMRVSSVVSGRKRILRTAVPCSPAALARHCCRSSGVIWPG